MGRRGWVYLILLIALLFSQAIGQIRQAHAAVPVGPTNGPTDEQWAKILYAHGFGDKAKLLTALEVLFAESGGNCGATNPTSGAAGCWQFMSNTLPDPQCARDPYCSTDAAARISKGGNDWSKWEAFTSGNYKGQESRARAAIAVAVPGCDWVMDTACFLKGIGQNVPTLSFGLPSLDQASPLDLLKVMDPKVVGEIVGRASAFMLAEVDFAMLKVFEALWADMIGGEDNISGQMRWGGNLVLIDNTPLHKVWADQLKIAIGPLMLLFILVLVMLRWFQAMLEEADASHDFKRDPLRIFMAVIFAASSFYLIEALLGISNALTNTIMANTHAELRMLPAYQGLNVLKPDFLTGASDYGNALIETVASLFIGIEIFLIFLLYVLRLLILGALIALAPYACVAWVLPPGRKLTYFWLGLLFAVVAIKPLNALIFSLYLTWGVSSSSGILNAVFLLAMLLFMAVIPTTLISAFGSPGAAWQSGHSAIRGFATYQPLRLGAGLAWNKLKTKVA